MGPLGVLKEDVNIQLFTYFKIHTTMKLDILMSRFRHLEVIPLDMIAFIMQYEKNRPHKLSESWARPNNKIAPNPSPNFFFKY